MLQLLEPVLQLLECWKCYSSRTETPESCLNSGLAYGLGLEDLRFFWLEPHPARVAEETQSLLCLPLQHPVIQAAAISFGGLGLYLRGQGKSIRGTVLSGNDTMHLLVGVQVM